MLFITIFNPHPSPVFQEDDSISQTDNSWSFTIAKSCQTFRNLIIHLPHFTEELRLQATFPPILCYQAGLREVL